MPAEKFPRIDLTVDAVVFGYKADEGISVLLTMRTLEPFKGSWSLPGGFVLAHESLEQALSRKLKEDADIHVNYLEQLYTFGDPKRDPRKRIVTVAYYALVRAEIFETHKTKDIPAVAWFPVKKLPKLAFDHKEIIQKALERIKNKIAYEPVGFELLDKVFSLTQLHHLYESLHGEPIDRRNFTKKLFYLGIIREVAQQKNEKGPGRPRTLYEFDKEKYFKLKKGGILFQV
jgi:8-oxo-dGTP diphosphatase